MRHLLLLLSLLLVLNSCSPDISGGVEEGNVVAGISGTVTSPEGDTLSNIVVDLHLHNSNSLESSEQKFRDTTDSNGKYNFKNLPAILYKLSVLNGVSGAAIIDSISYSSGDTVILDVNLKSTGAFRLDLPVRSSNDITYHIPGTTYERILHAGDSTIFFNGLPEGSTPIIVNENNGNFITPDSSIIADDTLQVNIMRIIIIADGDTSVSDNFKLQKSIIENLGIDVITLKSSEITDSIIKTAAAVYISYLADTSTATATILNSNSTPLVVANHNYFPTLYMTNTAADTGTTYGTESSTNSLVYYTTSSPILGYFNTNGTGTAGLNIADIGSPLWGVPYNTTLSKRLIVSSRDNLRCHLFSYDTGAQLFSGNASKKIVGIYTGDVYIQPAVYRLLEGSILWAAGYL